MTKKILISVGIAAVFLFFVPLFFLNKATISQLTVEDGFYESLTALFFFCAAGIFFYTFLKGKPRSVFFLLFALAFFFAAGEEISWGQRILHFSTPAALASTNAQKEFNLHNLAAIQHEHGFSGTLKSLLNFNRLFILFWVVYTILVPLADRYSGRLRGLFVRFRLPIAPLWFGLVFVINEVTAKAVELWVVSRYASNLDSPEIKEALWALIVLLMGIYFFSLLAHPEQEPARQAVQATS